MSRSLEALARRTTSSYALSIGTSLAFESIRLGPQPVYDPEREIPNHVDLLRYDEFYINLMTLFRNLVGALDKEGADVVMPHDLKDVLQQEVEIIKDVIAQETNNRVKVIFYTSDYANLQKHYPHASLRADNTEKQRIYTALMTNTLGLYYKEQVQSDTLLHFNLKLKPKQMSRALIMTHFAFDLLSYKDFELLELLESHTGVLKGRPLFYTKFHSGKNLMRIPFCEQFLQVFGDSQLFHPWPSKARNDVLEIAEKYQWNWKTTVDRIRLGLGDLKDPYLATVLKDMF